MHSDVRAFDASRRGGKETMMRSLTIFAGAAAIGAAVAAVAAPTPTPRPKAQEAYARLLAGKTAGEPVSCIDTRVQQPQLSAYGTKLIYRMSRNLVYVSETQGGCEGVARGDALVTRQFQTRLCQGDIARTIDFPARVETGSCALGQFVPYRAQ
jgi:hypothetical protein